MVDNVWNEKDSNPQIKKATSSGKENWKEMHTKMQLIKIVEFQR
jgi:hypothetical protein